MCEFLSAVKIKDKNGNDKYYFLTYALIHNTPRGKMLQEKYVGDDLIGHAAIRDYFELGKEIGMNWEQTNFSTPDNFPEVLAKAIKAGEFRGQGTPKGLLLDAVYAKWKAEWDAVDAKWKAEREAVAAKWNAEREAVAAKWNPERDAVEAKWNAEWDAVDARWKVEREAVRAKWNAEWDAVEVRWKVEREAVKDLFWDLFAEPKNRARCWR
jgi:hypothetical protein